MKNLERCRRFYEEYGAPMLHEKYGAYEDKLAAGLVGEGSDCFGFDDYISTDHDYGVGFCIWLDKEVYDEIGEKLQNDYVMLVKDYMAFDVQKDDGSMALMQSLNLYMSGRRGVFETNAFYEKLMGTSLDKWFMAPPEKLATVVNGEVFADNLGHFTKIRERIKGYYPDIYREIRLAEELYNFSQNAQSNYNRMMARKDYVTAGICVYQAIKSAMSIVYNLNRCYAPYYKWMRKGLDTLPVIREAGQLIDGIVAAGCQKEKWQGKVYNPYEVFYEDPVVALFEKLAALILEEMNRQEITNGTDPYLDLYSKELFAKYTAK